MTRRQSRLARHIERKTKKNLILSILGIIVVLFLLVKLGIPLLVNFSLFVANQKDKTLQAQKTNETSFIPAPVLNPGPSATNSAKLTVSGTASADQTIKLFVNERTTDEIAVKKDGTFSREIDLTKGENVIKAKALVKDRESDFSGSLTVVYKDTKPALDVSSPSDNQTFSKGQSDITVSGKTDADVKITVNGFWAIVDENNKFSYKLTLQSGENQIKVIATDVAGNTTEKDIKVTFNP